MDGVFLVKQLALCTENQTEVKAGDRAMPNISCTVVPNLSEELLLSVEDFKG